MFLVFVAYFQQANACAHLALKYSVVSLLNSEVVMYLS